MAEGRWLCLDPGETTGWSIWKGDRLLGGGQTPMWEFADDVWSALTVNEGPLGAKADGHLHDGIAADDNVGDIELVVCEKFALYPWEAKNLHWEEFRTVQLIGAIFFMCRQRDVELHKQSASIKERAQAGGAQELFVRPLHENRHQNDSIMHGFYYLQVGKK